MKIADVIAIQDGAFDITGVSFDTGDLNIYSIAVDFTGGASDLVGSLSLEVSSNGSKWFPIGESVQAVTGSTGHMWNVVNAGYRYVRPVWDYTSGTGNIQAEIVVKERTIKGV